MVLYEHRGTEPLRLIIELGSSIPFEPGFLRLLSLAMVGELFKGRSKTLGNGSET